MSLCFSLGLLIYSFVQLTFLKYLLCISSLYWVLVHRARFSVHGSKFELFSGSEDYEHEKLKGF